MNDLLDKKYIVGITKDESIRLTCKAITIDETIRLTCKAIKMEQESMSNILKAEIKRLEVIFILIEKSHIFLERPDELVREINNIIRSLLAYDCLIENKISALQRMYEELV